MQFEYDKVLEKCKNFFDYSLDLVYLNDLKGNFLYANDIALNLLGYNREDIKHLSLINLLDKENLKKAISITQKIVETGMQSEYSQFKIKTKGGDVIYIETYGIPLFKEGKVHSIIGIGRNITKLRKKELELQNYYQEREELEKIINQSPVIVFLWRNERGWPVEFVSENIAHFGYTPREFLSGSIPFSDIVYPEDLARVTEEVSENVEKGLKEFTQEYRIVNKNNEVRWVDDRTIVRRDSNGNVTHFQGIVLDITSKKEIERSLKESEQKFRSISEQSLLGIGILQDEFLKYANQRLTNIFRLDIDRTTWTFSNFVSIVHPEDREKLLKQVQRRKDRTKDTVTYYQLRLLSENNLVWINIFSKIINYQGKRASLITVLDVTPQKEAEQHLKESEEQFKELYKGGPIPSYTWKYIGGDFELIDHNNAAYDFTRGNVEKFLGKKATEMYSNQPEIIEDLKSCFEEKKTITKNIKLHIYALKGEREIVATYCFIHPNLVLVHARDITEKRIVERKLEDSEEKYRNLFEKAPYFIGLLNEEGVLVDCNDAVFGFLSKHSKSDLVGHHFKNIFSLYDKNKYIIPDLEQILNELLVHGRADALDFKLYRSIGGFIWCHLQGSVFELDGSKFIQILIQNITEKKVSEDKLIESEKFFRSIAESIQDGLSIIEGGKTVYINDRISQITGYNNEELMNMTDFDLAAPEEIDRLTEVYKSAKEKKEPLKELEYWIITKDGTRKCMQNRYTDLKAKSGENIRYVLTTDITERKESERRLKESEERYRKAYERENFYKDLFAHDMNNILTAIRMSLDISQLKTEKLEGGTEVWEMNEALKEQVNRGANLIQNVRKFSEIEESKKTLTRKDILSEILSVKEIMLRRFKEKNIRININYKKENYFVNADELLGDVFKNIVSNAIMHNENITIEIDILINEITIKDEKFVQIELIDNGIGIPDKRKEEIFRRGFKEYKSVSGLGLGLTLVKTILDYYGATISVENRIKDDYSKGSNFIIRFLES